MSMNKWPFVPGCLTEVLSEDVLNFIQSGTSIRLKLPVAIVEFRRDVTGKPFPVGIHADDPRLNFSEFCQCLRGNANGTDALFPEAEKVCRLSDTAEAERFLSEKPQPKQGHQGAEYTCHLGLREFIVPIKVAGEPVAFIFTGQMLPNTRAEIAEVEKRIGALGTRTNPIDVTSENSKDKLKDLLKTSWKYSPDTLQRLETEANRISNMAEESRALTKKKKEEEFLNDVIKWGNKTFDTLESLDEEMRAKMNMLQDWVGCQTLTVFLCEKSYDTLLESVFTVGGSLPKVDALQFNWKKVRPILEDPPDIFLNADTTATLGVPRNLRDNFDLIVPVATASGYRGVVCYGKGTSEVGIEESKKFLQRAAWWLCEPYLKHLDMKGVVEDEKQWEAATRLIAHELRNSLQLIDGEAFLMDACLAKETWVTEERAHKALERIRYESESLGAYSAEITDFWSQIGGKLEKVFETQSLREIVNNCISRVSGFAERSKVRIKLEWTIPRNTQVATIGRTLNIPFFNILENAIKYSAEDSYVKVSVKRIRENLISAEIENYGIGITPEDLPNIFKKGYRGKYFGRKGVREGEGLGLWQAKEVMRAHGGTISCVSRNYGRLPTPHNVDGFRTAFTLEFPQLQIQTKEQDHD